MRIVKDPLSRVEGFDLHNPVLGEACIAVVLLGIRLV